MSEIGDLIVSTAMEYNGLKEAPGAANNPEVVAFYAKSGHGEIKQDSVPWCAAFVGAVLAECGLQGTGSLLAQSYRKWGDKVPPDDVQVGDLAVMPRGSKSWQGHIGIVTKVAHDRVEIIGGNQSDMVSLKTHYKTEFFPDGFRRAKAPRQSLLSSTTIQAGAGGIVATATGGATAIASLDDTAQIIAIVAAAVVGLAFLYMMKERKSKWDKGDR